MIRSVLLSIVLIASAAAGTAQEIVDTDLLTRPLPIRDQFLLNNGFYFFEPESAFVLRDRGWLVDLRATDSNTFATSTLLSHSLEGASVRSRAGDKLSAPPLNAFDHVFLADGETHRLTLSVHHAVTQQLELGMAIPISTVGGGWQDALIEDFHHAFGLGQNARSSLTRNSVAVYLANGTTHYFLQRPSGVELGDVALTAKYQLAPGSDGTAYTIAGGIELPTGHAQTLAGSGSLDGGVQLLVTRKMRYGIVDASIGVLSPGPDRPLGTKRQEIVAGTVGFTHLFTGATSATMQLTTSQSPLRQSGYAELKRRSYQLSTGVQHLVGGRTAVHFAFIENLFSFENSADIGFAAGISRSW